MRRKQLPIFLPIVILGIIYCTNALAVPTGTGGHTFELGTDAGDDLNAGNGMLVVEGDTGRVGVGTTAPGAPIENQLASGANYRASFRSKIDGIGQGFSILNTNASYSNSFTTAGTLGFTGGDLIDGDFVSGMYPFSNAGGGMALVGNSNASGNPSIALLANQSLTSSGSSGKAAVYVSASALSGTSNAFIPITSTLFQVANNGSAVVSVLGSGNLGIGNSTGGISPTTPLYVSSLSGATSAITTTENTVGNFQHFVSSGSPQGVVTGSRGDLATDVISNPAVLYFKQTGDATNTGWQVASVGGNQANNYAYIYHDSSTSQTLSASDTWTDIVFNTNGQIDSGWTHSTSSNTHLITCNQSGAYLVSLVVTTTKSGGAPVAAVRALFNGTEVPGTYAARDIASNNSPTPITVTFILVATSGQSLNFQFAGTTTSISIIQPPQVAGATVRPQATVTIVPVE